jgi:hypothetical protein
MSRGTPKPLQDASSSEWLLQKIEELRRLLQEVEQWPETGNQLLADLSHFNPLLETTPSNEDYEMLSIVVNDALIGIDVIKKYPHFYSRMLVSGELRTAFLDTLELLEQSRAGELPEYSGSTTIDLSFLQEVMSRPTIRKSLKDKWALIWQRSAEQLQNMFYFASLQPSEVYRSGDSYLEESYINILHSQFKIDEQELAVRLDALKTVNAPENLDLMLAIFAPEELGRQFEVTIAWGDYQQTAEVNKYGLAKLPSLRIDQIFAPTGQLIQGLELCLNQVN